MLDTLVFLKVYIDIKLKGLLKLILIILLRSSFL